jgi:hypothetical protein
MLRIRLTNPHNCQTAYETSLARPSYYTITLVYWPRICVNIFFATPLGKKKDQSATIAGNIAKPGEIDAENIQRLNFEQLSAEDHKALDDIKKKIREEKEQEIQRQEQEAMKHYMSHFSVDRQGKVTKIKDVTTNSPQNEVKTDVSKQPALVIEIANIVDGVVTAHLNNKLDFVGQNLHSIFDARFSRIEAHLGMKSIGNDKHVSTSGIDKMVGSSASEGIPAAVTNAMVINSANQLPNRMNEPIPHHTTLYGSALLQVCHMGQQIRCDMPLHRRTLLNPMAHQLQIGLGLKILDRATLKMR